MSITFVCLHDQFLGGERAVLFFEKVSPAVEHVDSSSGAIGRVVNHAIEALVPIIAKAPADDALRHARTCFLPGGRDLRRAIRH